MLPWKHYGKVQWNGFVELVAKINSIPFGDWMYRSDPESYETRVVREGTPSFPKRLIEDLLNAASVNFEPGYTNRLVLSCVPAGKEILPHVDDFGEKVRSTSYHCHIPLVTHPEVVIGFDSGALHMQEQHLYSLDETYRHWVKNPTTVDRIHLLFAYFPHSGNKEN